MNHNITLEFTLPYIIQPKGTYNFKYDNEEFIISIKHERIPKLQQILTGLVLIGNQQQITIGDKLTITGGGQGTITIQGPKEIYSGISTISIQVPSSYGSLTQEGGKELRKKIVSVLNDYQYQYLHVTQKYWWNAISTDHFISFNIKTEKSVSMSASWGRDKKSLAYKEDKAVKEELETRYSNGVSLSLEDIYLIEAKHHYLTTEYHLMYVEIGIIFESLTSRCEQKLYNKYEKRMFKEGKLIGRLIYLLTQKCAWSIEESGQVEKILNCRNQVIHNNRRNFKTEIAYEHLVASEKVIQSLKEWLNTFTEI